MRDISTISHYKGITISFESVFKEQVYACRKRGAGGGALAPQFLAKQLTLSQPGVQIMPTTVLQAPPPQIFRPCDGPEVDIYESEL